MNLQEDYCSKEITDLLKEKGFVCGATYSKGFVKDGDGFVGGLIRHEDNITHQMAMKWLREVHKIWFLIYRDFIKGKWDYAVHHYNYGQEFNHGVIIYYNSYEEAVEAAIKYCLTNLI